MVTRKSAKPDSSRYTHGWLAEELAMLWLRLKGYRILGHRLRTPLGEIDLLARRGATVAVIEVKYRDDLDNAAAAISATQKQRLYDAARFILAGRPELSNHSLRFDAVLVNRLGRLRHVVNAWSPL